MARDDDHEPKRVHITARLEPELVARLDRLADEYADALRLQPYGQASRSGALRLAVELGVETLERRLRRARRE